MIAGSGGIMKGCSLMSPTETSLIVGVDVASGMELQVADIGEYQTLFDSVEARDCFK